MNYKIDDEKIYTIKDISEMFAVTEPTVLRNIKNGNIKATQVFSRWKILGKDLKKIIKY